MVGEPRKLGPNDLSACLRLDRLALRGLWTREQWQRELSDNSRLVMGINDEDRSLIALASAWLVVDELQITAVAVEPIHQRCGLGARVLQALMARAGSIGALSATLEVASANEAARALYARSGFITIGRRAGYYSNGDDALLQSRSIRRGRDFHTDQTE